MSPPPSPLLPPLSDAGSKAALRFGAEELSYAEVAGVAGALAGRIAGLGRVAVWATPTLATCAAITAALVAGVPVVPVNPRVGGRELAHVVGDAAPQAVLTAPEAALPAELAVLPRIDVRLDEQRAFGGPEPAPDRPALVVYTSGTTGPPKGAVLPRSALAANLDALADAWAWTAEDELAHALPLFHVHGLVLGVLGVLRRGSTLHHIGSFDAARLAAAVERGASMVFGVPTHYHRLATELAADGSRAAAVARARLLVSGSAALTTVDHAAIAERTGLAIRERYGMTETLILTAARADRSVRPGTVGHPLRDTEVRLTADAGDVGVAETGEIGDVQVRGPGLFTGYLNRPEATAAGYTADGWFRTGDLGRFRPDTGELELLGRRSTDLISSGGYKIGAGEIENTLLEHPGVAEAAVVGVADADLGERVVAWVVPVADGDRPSEAELVELVASQLAPHKRPREVRFAAELPRNDLGKVVKARLPR